MTEGRSDLAESNEYGQESLVKATKQVLDKIDVLNTTVTKITSKERENRRLWNPVALREAVINAFVHNDYSNEVPPKFEVFSDRIEIMSAGGLPEGLSKAEFFEGFSVPRNRELMRLFRDLSLIEQLGSGVPRILETYSRNCFSFSDNFLRMAFPASEGATDQLGEQVSEEVQKVIRALEVEMKLKELMDALELSHRENFKNNYLEPAMKAGFIEMTSGKPKSSKSKISAYSSGKSL